MNVQLLRHATTIISLNSKTILVDPMLSPAGSLKPVTASPNQQNNPLLELPVSIEQLDELMDKIDAVLLTHTHFDHFDEAAANLLPKGLPVFCQPEDLQKLISKGFTKVNVIDKKIIWEGIAFTRTRGRHGKGMTGKLMGPVSGYLLKAQNEPSLYIAGDTLWCNLVEKALEAFNPDVVVVYSGAAQFLKGGPITMDKEDVYKVCSKAVNSKIVAVHMEAVNHCLLTREALRDYLVEKKMVSQILIPNDGECLEF